VVTLRVDRQGSLIPRYFIRPDCLPRIELARQRFIRTDRYQLDDRPTPNGSLVELYDWRADPDLERNLATSQPAIAADLRARLYAWALGSPDLALRDGHLTTRDPHGLDRCAPHPS
jgi:hypothetical protein